MQEPRPRTARPRTSGRWVLALGAAALVVGTAPASAASPGPAASAPSDASAASWGPASSRACPPHAVALSYSDALDKASVAGTTVGGLSDLAADPRSGSYVSTVDDHGSDPARLWRIGDPRSPHLLGAPLVLRHPDGTPFTGLDADDEGLAVIPDGDYLVSSETEPAIRVFGRDGVQRGALEVPARFAVAPAGQATANATLEGLTISPSGRYVVAAMEGTLSGDLPAGGGEGTYRRFLVYQRSGSSYRLLKQVGYRVDPGMRIPEVAAYDDGELVVEEASYSASTGNAVRLYAVTALGAAPDVSAVADLAAAPAADVVGKQLVADLVRCPSLGARAKEAQTNPLLDNVEGMAITARAPAGRSGRHAVRLALVSDDNFSATQTTRIITLAALLP